MDKDSGFTLDSILPSPAPSLSNAVSADECMNKTSFAPADEYLDKTSTAGQMPDNGPRRPNLRPRVKRVQPVEVSIPVVKRRLYKRKQHWTEFEKYQLAEALEKYGMLRISKLLEAVPTKKVNEIKSYIEQRMKSDSRKRRTSTFRTKLKYAIVDRPRLCPLDQWIRYLMNADGKDRQIMSHIFLLISEMEPHPNTEDCDGINFKDLYEYLHHMANGFPTKVLDKATAAFLKESLKGVSERLKAEGDNGRLLAFLNRSFATASKPALNTYPGKRQQIEKNPEFVMDVLSKHSLNPLGFPANILKM